MTDVQIIPLGGAGEIGKNCTAVVQGDDMILVDVGLSFPNEEMYGVDIVIPDFTYVIQNRNKLRAIFLTHAHEDHIGALPYLLPKVRVPVYASELTLALVRNKLSEKMDMKDVDLRPLPPGASVEAGKFTVEAVRVTHSIPETCAIGVKTDHGWVLFTADFKFDFTPVDGQLTDVARLAAMGVEGVVCLLSDSTNMDRPGWGPSERMVSIGLRAAFKQAKGRVLITTFASNIHRMQQAFDIAKETGRKVAVAGRRMEQTIDICSKLGYLKIPSDTKIRLDDASKMPHDKLVILTTGSQGEPLSALVQMSKETYSRAKVLPGDTIIYSARPIPGNEGAIWRTVNRLFRMGATVIYDHPTPVHVSGHGYREELKLMVNLTRPYYLAPVHGEPRHSYLYRQMGLEMGYPDHRIFTMECGVPLTIQSTDAHLDEPVACGRVLVDNGGNPGVSDEVLRDRSNLAEDGLVIATVAIDVEKGEIVGDPEIQARGYSGSDNNLQEAAEMAYETLRGLRKSEIQDVDMVRHSLADALRKVLHRKTQMRPLVIAVVLEV
jgi:ribonuclease J